MIKSFSFVLPEHLHTFTGTLQDDDEHEAVLMHDLHLEQGVINDVRISQSRLDLCGWPGTTVRQAKFDEVMFTDCDFATTRFERSLIDRCRFEKCRMTGFRGTESNFRSVVFQDCQLKLAQFRMAKLNHIVFDHCLLEEADFYGADMSNVEFIDCVLLRADFSATTMNTVDLRSSQISGMTVTPESLRGAIIDPSQVPDLAHLLGAKIEWKNDATFH